MEEESNLRKDQSTILHYGGAFGIRVIPTQDDRMVVELIGELDVVSMEMFEGTVADLLSGQPSELLFDLTRSGFVCAQAYSVMGRCSAVTRVTVCSTSELSARVLAIYGHEDVVVRREAESHRYAPR